MASNDDSTREESRAGDLSNGWGRLEIGVARAVFHALGGNQGTVFWAVVERAWCYPWFRYRTGDPIPSAEPCKLNIAELARATGQVPECLMRAKRKLISTGLLIEHSDGKLEPNKKYDQAAGLGLSPEMVAYCLDGASVMRAARATAEERPYHAPKAAPKRQAKSPVKQSASALGEPAKQSASALVGVANSERQRSDPMPENRAPALRIHAPIHNRELIQDSQPRASASATEEDFKGNDFQGPPETIAQVAARECTLLTGGCTPGPFVPDTAILSKLDAKLDEWFPMADNIRPFIRMHRRQVSSENLMRLMKRCRVRNIAYPGDALFRTILRTWGANGGPDHGPEEDYDDDLNLLAFKPGTVSKQYTRFEPPTPPPPVERYVEPEKLACYPSVQKGRFVPKEGVL